MEHEQETIQKMENNKMKEMEIEKMVLHCGGTENKLEKSIELLNMIVKGKNKIFIKQSTRRIPAFGISPGKKSGCKVTLNSDDPPFFHTNIGKEYENGYTNFGLSIEDLLGITRTAIDAAFLNEAEKGKLYAKIDSWEYSG